MRKHYTLLIITLAAVLLTGCSKFRFPGVYRIDIPQGNFTTEDMLSQLQPGMTPDQVTYVMGEPILIDPFTDNAWFYPMIYQPGKGKKTEQRIVVYFEDGYFSHYDGHVINHQVAEKQDKELDRHQELELRRQEQEELEHRRQEQEELERRRQEQEHDRERAKSKHSRIILENDTTPHHQPGIPTR